MDPRAAPTSFEDFLKQQIESNPDFVDVYEETRIEGDLALALARRREECGLTQRALAEKSGIKQPMIARIERAGQTPTTTTLWRLLTALDAVVEMGPSSVAVRPATPQLISFAGWRTAKAQAAKWDATAVPAATATPWANEQSQVPTEAVLDDQLVNVEPGITSQADTHHEWEDFEYISDAPANPQEFAWAS